MHRAGSDSDETLRLLDEVQAGDPEAFNRLFARYRAYLRQVVDLRMDRNLRSRADPSDVVQETQMVAFNRLAEYLERRPIPFRLWLRRMAHERLIKIRRRHVRAARRTVQREVSLPADSSIQLARRLLASGSSPSRQLAKRELAQKVRQAVAELPDGYREVLLMRSFEKLPYDEIAYILQIEPATARKRHGRAIVRLGTILSEGGLTESQL